MGKKKRIVKENLKKIDLMICLGTCLKVLFSQEFYKDYGQRNKFIKILS